MALDEDTIYILRKVVLDAFLIGGLSFGIFVTKFWWSPFQRGFFCGDESLMFPFHSDTVPTVLLHSVGLCLPIFTIVVCEWALLRGARGGERRCLGVKLPAWLRGAYCALASFAFGTVAIELCTNIAKNTIGRPRPYFFEVCAPSIDCSSEEWRGRYVEPEQYTCNGFRKDMFREMRLSFISGHSAWSAYTMIFLALYLQQRMCWRGTRLLRHAMQFGVVMLSWFTALSRVSDYKHHWSDVLAGYSAGLIFAVLVWTYGTDLVQRREHKPLPLHEQPPLPFNDVRVNDVT